VREAMKGPPSGYFIVVSDGQDDTADDLATFGSELWASWKILLATAVLGGVIAAVVALMLPAKFRAQALVAPVNQSGGAGGGALKQLGGLAALAGIDLGSGGGRKEESLATLNSMGFARDFIQAENLIPVLYAERWDAQAKRWRAGETPPTLGMAVKRFTNDVVSISDDHKTSFVTVTVDWYSPELAARWANRMIEMANERLRADATRSAEHSIEYLNKELAKTSVVEIRQAIYRLSEEQVNNAMLASVQREYAFRFIDAAVPPETKFSPKRALIASVGAAGGLFVGVLVVFVRRMLARSRQRSMAGV
jgi:capsular polysaccharide biosynthesis protein